MWHKVRGARPLLLADSYLIFFYYLSFNALNIMDAHLMMIRIFAVFLSLLSSLSVIAAPMVSGGSSQAVPKAFQNDGGIPDGGLLGKDNSLDFDFIITGGFLEIDSHFYGDESKVNPFSNLNHGLGLSAFFPENLIPSPFGLSLYFQGKYMTFSESTDKKLALSKFMDIDYGIRMAVAVIDHLVVQIDVGIASNPMTIRRSIQDFKIVQVPSTLVGTKLMYTVDLPENWSFTISGQQYLLGPSVASGIKLREGQGYGVGGQFNVNLHDLGYAYIGYTGTTEQQNSDQGTHRRAEDLISFGFSFSMEDGAQEMNPGH
jgi:hypothetical protein